MSTRIINTELSLTANPTTVRQGETVTLSGYLNMRSAGDLDGNNSIGIRDIVAVAQAFGSKPGYPNWNPEADLDKNGYIGIVDIVMVAMNFGENSNGKTIYIQRSYDGQNWENIAEVKTYRADISGAFSYQYTVNETPPKTIYFRAYFPGVVY